MSRGRGGGAGGLRSLNRGGAGLDNPGAPREGQGEAQDPQLGGVGGGAAGVFSCGRGSNRLWGRRGRAGGALGGDGLEWRVWGGVGGWGLVPRVYGDPGQHDAGPGRGPRTREVGGSLEPGPHRAR